MSRTDCTLLIALQWPFLVTTFLSPLLPVTSLPRLPFIYVPWETLDRCNRSTAVCHDGSRASPTRAASPREVTQRQSLIAVVICTCRQTRERLGRAILNVSQSLTASCSYDRVA